jgi:hypothetical protein
MRMAAGSEPGGDTYEKNSGTPKHEEDVHRDVSFSEFVLL